MHKIHQKTASVLLALCAIAVKAQSTYLPIAPSALVPSEPDASEILTGEKAEGILALCRLHDPEGFPVLTRSPASPQGEALLETCYRRMHRPSHVELPQRALSLRSDTS